MEKGHRGFSLIELMAVIAIMGIMAGLGFTNYTTSLKRTRDAQRKTDLGQVKSFLEIYRADMGAYPTGDATTDFHFLGCGLTCGDVCIWGYSVWTCGGKTYMSKLPGDPKPGYPHYNYTGGGNEYTLAACLEIASDPQGTTGGWCPSGKAYWIKNP